MEKEVYLAIGAFIGALGTFGASIFTIKGQKELAQINAQRDIDRDKLKYEAEENSKIKDRVLNGFEKAHKQLSAISHHFSLTGASLNKPSNYSVSDFDIAYSEHCKNLSNVTMLLHIYASEYNLSTDELEAAMNNYWGNYRGYLHAKQNGQSQVEQKLLENVCIYAAEVCKKTISLQSEIKSLAHQLIT